MRIGFFVWEYPPQIVGGLGTYAEYITREFVQLGHDVTVFTLNPGKPENPRLFQSFLGFKRIFGSELSSANA
ncbi:MAG: glycosyltransferase [Candidatus Bathyarchaeia archaeon]